MVKRTAAIVIILLGNIMLLAQAVVPHHHHHLQVCFVKSHCENDDTSNSQKPGEDNHHHDSENNSDNCVLKMPVVILSNHWEQVYKFGLSTYNSNFSSDFHYALLNNETELSIPVQYYDPSDHTVNCSYSLYVSVSLGLRAPPTA